MRSCGPFANLQSLISSGLRGASSEADLLYPVQFYAVPLYSVPLQAVLYGTRRFMLKDDKLHRYIQIPPEKNPPKSVIHDVCPLPCSASEQVGEEIKS